VFLSRLIYAATGCLDSSARQYQNRFKIYMLCIDLSYSDFYGTYFERKFCHFPSVMRSGMFPWCEIDDLLFRLDPQKPEDVRVIRSGNVAHNEYSVRFQDLHDIRHKIVPQKLQSLLQSGATIVMNRLELKSRKIASICQAISDRYQLKTVANGYFALGDGEGTFGKHWDTHDVFALQLLGAKHWRVYKPTFQLPLEHQKSKNVKDTCPEKPVFDDVLNAGDMLYIPRGWWHEATPLKGEATFHIAVGTHTAKMIDYLIWAANELLPMHELSRASATDQSWTCIKEFSAIVSAALSDPASYAKFCNLVGKMRNSYEPFNMETVVSLATTIDQGL
jgi:hypothetical protein